MYSLSAAFEAKVDAAAEDGLSIIYLVCIQYPTLGWINYGTRATALDGVAYYAKLKGPPSVDKQAHFGAAQGSMPLNSALTVDLINTPETEYGETDTARIQDLVAQYGILGALVKVGVVEAGLTTYADAKWDGVYRVDGYSHSANVVRLSLVDAMLHPGEAEVTVKLGAHFPLAPDSSKGQTVGPVFGKCDGIELIPVVGGNTVMLYSAITETATQATLWGTNWRNLTATGVLYIENERCVYNWISGGTSTDTLAVVGLIRNDGNVDSVPVEHAAGSQVHICAMSGGSPLYRYAVGIADTFNCLNYRAILRDGTPFFLSAGASASGTVDIAGRKLWYLDWTSRIKAENYSTSTSSFERGFAETVLTRGADGYATPTGFAYWAAGSGCGSSLVAQIPLALDPKASTQALYLKANSATSKVLHLVFSLDLGSTLTTFLHKYGRFAGARLNLRLQYNKVSDYRPSWRIEHDSVLVPFDGASGTIEGPPDAVDLGSGSISGEAPVAKENWEQTTTETEIKLAVRAKGYIGTSWTYATMVDPNAAAIASGTTQAPIPVANLTDGNKQTGVGAIDWAAGYDPLELVSTSTASPPAGVTNTFCNLYTVNRMFESAATLDKLTSLRLYAYHMHDSANAVIAAWQTGFDFIVTAWSGENLTGTKLWTSPTWYVGKNEATKYYDIPLAAFAKTKPQSIGISVYMFSNPVWDGTYYNWYGRVVGGFNLYMSVQKYIEGAQDDVMVDGGFFSLSGSGGNVPSAVYDYSIPLTDLVNKWAQAGGVNAWEFFNDTASEGGDKGMGFKLSIASATGDLEIAIGDIELELDYNAYAPEWDAPLLADLDGQTGSLISGGTGVLETPMDLLLYLVDNAYYMNLAGYSDAAEFAAVHAYTSQYKLARAVREETTLQELIGSLCAECGCALLFDGESIYPKRITPSFALASSVMEIGTQSDKALGLVSDDVMLEQPLDSYACRVSFGYRKSNFFSGAEGGIVQSAVSPIHSIFARRAMKHKTLEWHSSWRGYGSRAAQDAIVAAYAQQQLALVSTPWEYIDVTLYLAAGEKLQRGDIVKFSYTRIGLVDVPARVVSTTRIAFDQWRVRLQLYPGTSAYYWFYSARSSYPDYGTYPNVDYWLRYRLSLTELEVVIWGVHVATINASGDILVKGDIILAGYSGSGRVGVEGTPQHNAITADTTEIDPRILFWLWREEDATYELVMALRRNGDLYLYGDRETTNLRDWLTGGTYSETDAGVHDTGDGESVTGQLRFSTGATVKCYIGSSINAEPYANSIGDLTAGDV